MLFERVWNVGCTRWTNYFALMVLSFAYCVQSAVEVFGQQEVDRLTDAAKVCFAETVLAVSLCAYLQPCCDCFVLPLHHTLTAEHGYHRVRAANSTPEDAASAYSAWRAPRLRYVRASCDLFHLFVACFVTRFQQQQHRMITGS